MVRPVRFRYNEETAVNNYYQQAMDGLTPEMAQEKASAEFDNFVHKLEDKGVQVIVINDNEDSDTPDSIFPNNWVSFHHDGRIAIYPMYAENRRAERREEIFEMLRDGYGFQFEEIVDFTEFEDHDKYLEGTGSMILDRENKVAYAAVSQRTDEHAFVLWCDTFDYDPISFTANQTVIGKRMPIYHTNVMMCVAQDFAIICLDSIDDTDERHKVVEALERTGKTVIDITEAQVNRFAGNMLQVKNEDGQPFLVMSSSAYHSLTEEQRNAIEKHCPIIHSSLDTIEACGGGSARCMMAEVFLPKI